MSGLILRRFKRSKEERESSAARRDTDKGENSERTNEPSSKARNQASNKDKKQEERLKDSRVVMTKLAPTPAMMLTFASGT